MNDKSDIVVVGGVACGPKAAAALMRRRLDVTVTLFQKEKLFSYGSCGMPYFASGDVGSFNELMKTAYGVVRDEKWFAATRGFTAVPSAEVIAIDRKAKTVRVKLLEENREIVHGYEYLVLATGATPNKAPFEIPEDDCVRNFTRPDDAIHFRKLAETGQIGSVAIIGGGFIGCELAEAAAGLWGIETTLIEREGQVLPYALDPEMALLAEAEMKRQGVAVHTGAGVERIVKDGEHLTLHVTGLEPVTVDYVFLCVGVHPATDLAVDCGLEIGPSRGIAVNEYMQTSDPCIYAGGDCVESVHILTGQPLFLPMGSLANRHGRVIADHITDGNSRFPGVLGAFLVKVFDVNVGAVGLSEEAAKRAGLNAAAVWGTFGDKPEFYPESSFFTAKMVYCPDNMQLLGIQVAGPGNICRRVDVFSSYLGRKATVADLLEFEHGYAPPYSEALDPLHQLASMAEAQQRGFGFTLPSEATIAEGKPVLLDVRTNTEVETDPLPLNPDLFAGIHKIPLEDLAERIGELDPEREIAVICQRGPRSYQAAVILKKAGFNRLRIVGGGASMLKRQLAG
ncbi:MAG TPA: FAD-dependent oxidoreductase [candidate division Zixibacteria bacterium]|nr:FAD-dependent oxidoreductase [candidate division Zixibacteria bacterium]